MTPTADKIKALREAQPYGYWTDRTPENAWNARVADIERKSTVDADIEAIKQNMVMGICSTDCPDDPAWQPTVQAARLFEYAMYMLLDHADGNAAQKAANEALGILKAHKHRIEQLHARLEVEEGAEP